jgi:hypothetical protein
MDSEPRWVRVRGDMGRVWGLWEGNIRKLQMYTHTVLQLSSFMIMFVHAYCTSLLICDKNKQTMNTYTPA